MDSPARLNPPAMPVFTLLLCAAAAIVFLVPALQSALIYDRAAIADGAWWRLVTGNLVHYSLSHLLFDVAAVLIAGAFIEARGYRGYPGLCFLVAAATGIVLYVGVPQMAYYGGLSAVATASVVYLCLHGLREERAWRRLCLGVLAVMIGKIGIELAFGTSVMVYLSAQSFTPMPISHAVGAASAVLVYLSLRNRRPERLPAFPHRR